MRNSGIFLGFVCALLANALITKNGWVTTESWRVMLATASIPPTVLLILVFISPESPRFLIRTGKYSDACKSLLALRGAEILASRDLYSIHHQLEREEHLNVDRFKHRGIMKQMGYLKRTWNLFANPRNRRTCQSAFLVMMTQQLCGVSPFSSLLKSVTIASLGCSINLTDQCSHHILVSNIQESGNACFCKRLVQLR